MLKHKDVGFSSFLFSISMLVLGKNLRALEGSPSKARINYFLFSFLLFPKDQPPLVSFPQAFHLPPFRLLP